MKIVLAHPGVGPFVQQTARALLEEDLLASYWTTFVDQPEACWRRALVRLATAIGVNIERELQRRAVKEVPPTFLRLLPFWEVVGSVLVKMRADTRLVDAIWEMVRLASRHDLGLASELDAPPNRAISLANKKFTYLLAGIRSLDAHC